LEHGGSVFEGEPFTRYGRSGADEADVAALRGVMAFAARDAFEFVLSENSLAEVSAAADAPFLQWAYDVSDHSRACLDAGPPTGVGASRAAKLDAGACDYLSAKDARLLRDAVMLDCDTFLTIERRLPRNAAHLSRILGIEVLRPPELMTVLAPHVGAL
jgi:hypothetical protein